MSGHRHATDAGMGLINGSLVGKPASGQAIELHGRDFVVVRGFGAGTFKFPQVDERGVGTIVRVVADGAQTWQNPGGTNVAALQSGQAELFYAITTTTWASPAASLAQTFLTTFQGHIDIPLYAVREVDADGDVSAIAANGGVLASDTTPIMEGASTTNAQRIAWVTGDVDRIGAVISLPPDFDGTKNAHVRFIVASGTTNSFDATVITNWDGGADVSDIVSDAASATPHAANAVVSASDIPDAALSVSISVTPPTHATDPFHVYGMCLRYCRKLITP